MQSQNFGDVLRFVNEAQTVEDLLGPLETAFREAGQSLAAKILLQRAAAGGSFESIAQLQEAGLAIEELPKLSEAVGELLAFKFRPQPERRNFRALLLENPNFFGNLEDSPFQPVTPIQGDTTYEEVTCLGLNPPFDRLESIIEIKRNSGYGGGICTDGSFEYVRFYVDLQDDGNFDDVGLGSVRVYNISGSKPLCYAVYVDFESIRKRCTTENVVRVRAILSWNVPPPANSPNFTPVWGNVRNAQVQIHPRFVFPFGDLVAEIDQAGVNFPEVIEPLLKSIKPATKLEIEPAPALSVAAKKEQYLADEVPVHRFAFPEAQQLLSSAAAGAQAFDLQQSPLIELGLDPPEIKDLIGVLQGSGDGNTSFEELVCIGLKPEQDLLEGVITIKQNSGYSGGLCGPGSTEYVAFWIDFGDGAGFIHAGTTSVAVHDLQQIPPGGLQYAVFLKTNLAEKLIQCQLGARVVRLRAILSWEDVPPNNPNWVPFWGNREECRIQLRPKIASGHTPFIETVGDVGINDISLANGLASGIMPIAGVALQQAPFGRGIAITGRIGNPPNSFSGTPKPFKYKIEVAPDGTNDWQPLTNKITVKKSEFLNGTPVPCALFEFVCDVTLTPTDDGDGLGPGWYDYIEDLTPPQQRFLVLDLLGRWETNASMEGLWKMRITAKDPNTSPPDVFAGFQSIKIRVDNTAPEVALAITKAEFNGAPIAAVACGKFPVGTIIGGTFAVHDPGTVSAAPDFQHYNNTVFDVLATGPAVTTVPAVRTFPTIGTTGLSGDWELDTHGMQACGYVLRMVGIDRTNVNSRGNHFRKPISIGFCLEDPE